MNYEFCFKSGGKKFEAAAFSAMKKLIGKPKAVRHIYSKLKCIYDKSEKDFMSNYYPLEKEMLNPTFKINGIMMGIDFPIWLRKEGEKQKKRIMILGQDPIRNKKYFIKRNVKKDVVIGTPYSFHYKKERNGKKNYWEIVKLLLDEGYSIYLTDIYKIWAKDSTMDKLYEKFKVILDREIEQVKPKYIITFGKTAAESMIGKQELKKNSFQISTSEVKTWKIQNKLKVIPLLHPVKRNESVGYTESFIRNNLGCYKKYKKNVAEAFLKIIFKVIK